MGNWGVRFKVSLRGQGMTSWMLRSIGGKTLHECYFTIRKSPLENRKISTSKSIKIHSVALVSCVGEIYIYRYLSVYRVYTYYLIILWMCVKNVETSRILRHRHTQTHMIYIKKYTYQVYTCNPMKRHRNHYQLPLQPRQPCCQGLYTDNTSQHTIPWLRLWRNGILQWRT